LSNNLNSHTREYFLSDYFNQVAEDEMGGPRSTNGGEEERLWFIGGKARGKETTNKTKSRWVDNIRMDLGEMGWGDVDWIDLAKDRNRWRALVNSVLNLRVP
jgi:hypothetical protein